MSRFLIFLIVLSLTSMSYAADTGNRFDGHKVPLPYNPDQGDGREGGETIGTAVVIPTTGFSDSGNTCDNIDDYDEACPYTGSTSPDVVYSYTPAVDELIIIDLCFSEYDTKLYVYENDAGNLVACNDDFYFGPPCHVYSSRVAFDAAAGNTYYIVIDGYGGACGFYSFGLPPPPPPPPIVCPDYGIQENEPPLVDYYIDNWNGGCNSTPPIFQPIHWIDTTTGCGVLCGISGWYSNFGSYRDTDWFPVTAADFEMTFTVCAEQSCNIFVLNTDCNNIIVYYSANTGGNNQCATITWPTNPGEEYVLWIGPDAFSGPVNEFNYLATVCGHVYDTVPVQASSWGAVKEMFK